jgi:hypothetical protein
MKDTPAGLGNSELSGALADGWRHVADVVPSGELDRLRETIEVLSDTELVRELRQAWPNACGIIATSRSDSGQVLSELLQQWPSLPPLLKLLCCSAAA